MGFFFSHAGDRKQGVLGSTIGWSGTLAERDCNQDPGKAIYCWKKERGVFLAWLTCSEVLTV